MFFRLLACFTFCLFDVVIHTVCSNMHIMLGRSTIIINKVVFFLFFFVFLTE